MNSRINPTFLTILVLLLTSSISLSAQDYAVKPLTDYLDTYKEKHQEISQILETRGDITFAEKLSLYETEISKLKEGFKDDRKAEYLSKSVKRAKRHSCKGTRIRGITDCKAVSIEAPNKNMYTSKDWVKVEGENTKVEVSPDNSSVSLSLTATGTRLTEGVIFTVFKYRPELINSIVNKESINLFSKITDKTLKE